MKQQQQDGLLLREGGLQVCVCVYLSFEYHIFLSAPLPDGRIKQSNSTPTAASTHTHYPHTYVYTKQMHMCPWAREECRHTDSEARFMSEIIQITALCATRTKVQECEACMRGGKRKWWDPPTGRHLCVQTRYIRCSNRRQQGGGKEKGEGKPKHECPNLRRES